MTTLPRALILQFTTANALLARASVTYYDADPITGVRLSSLATLYANPTSAGTLANPQTLDGAGKHAQPVYIETPVIAVAETGTIDAVVTGVITTLGDWRGTWATAQSFNARDMVVDGSNGASTYSVYICTEGHTSGTWATDLAAAKWSLMIDATSILSGTLSLDSGDDKWNAASKLIKNLGDAANPQDAVTKSQLDAAVVAAGNVPTPADPGDDNKVLTAGSGTWSWVAFAISMISDAAAFMKTFLGSADVATARINLGLGSAAEKTAGASAGNVPVLDGSGDVPSANLPAASTSVVGAAELATQAEMETATDAGRVPSVSVLQNHPGVSKVSVKILMDGSNPAGHNVSSITDNGTGDFNINFTTAFSSTNYIATTSIEMTREDRAVTIFAFAANTCRAIIRDAAHNPTEGSVTSIGLVFYGDQ